MSSCTLTPQARAFSSILSAFIGSIMNGITAGYLVAFMTGWIAWLAFFRVVISGSYMLYRSATGTWTAEAAATDYQMISAAQTVAPGEQVQASPPPLNQLHASSTYAADSYYCYVYTSVFGADGSAVIQNPKKSFLGAVWPTRSDLAARYRTVQLAQQKRAELRKYYASDSDLATAIVRFTRLSHKRRLPGPDPNLTPWQPLNQEVTWLGWVGWIYGAIYAPISQIIWIAANASPETPSGVVKIVKGLSVAVTALPLGIDTRVRYAESLRVKRLGGDWAYYTFNLANAGSCLLQGAFCGTLLTQGVLESSISTPIIAIYPILSMLWAYVSFGLLPVADGSRKPVEQSWMSHIRDVAMGIFAGLFLATPALSLYVRGGGGESARSDLAEFLKCEVPGWQKFSAIFP